LLSAPLAGWLVLEHRFGTALVVTLLAAASDWLDGWAARHIDRGQTELGTVLDPIADKAFLITLFLCCGPAGLIPIWLVSLVLGRDLVIVAGSLLIRWRRGPVRFLPLPVGKVSTFFQIISVLLVLLYGWGGGLAGDLGGPIFVGATFRLLKNLALAQTAFFTALSGVAYIQRGIEIARRQGSGQGTGVSRAAGER
jgi:cardiolipin synthase (CMP-forming)